MYLPNIGERNKKKVFGFKDNCICIWHVKFSPPQKGYLSLAVNVLQNTPKVSDMTKGGFLQILFSQSDGKI